MEQLLKRIAEKYLEVFLKDFASRRKELDISVWKGEVNLPHVVIEERVLQSLSGINYIEFKEVSCSGLSMRIPWANLKSERVVVKIKDVHVVLEEPASPLTLDPLPKLFQPDDGAAAKSKTQKKKKAKRHWYEAAVENISLSIESLSVNIQTLGHPDLPYRPAPIAVVFRELNVVSVNQLWQALDNLSDILAPNKGRSILVFHKLISLSEISFNVGEGGATAKAASRRTVPLRMVPFVKLGDLEHGLDALRVELTFHRHARSGVVHELHANVQLGDINVDWLQQTYTNVMESVEGLLWCVGGRGLAAAEAAAAAAVAAAEAEEAAAASLSLAGGKFGALGVASGTLASAHAGVIPTLQLPTSGGDNTRGGLLALRGGAETARGDRSAAEHTWDDSTKLLEEMELLEEEEQKAGGDKDMDGGDIDDMRTLSSEPLAKVSLRLRLDTMRVQLREEDVGGSRGGAGSAGAAGSGSAGDASSTDGKRMKSTQQRRYRVQQATLIGVDLELTSEKKETDEGGAAAGAGAGRDGDGSNGDGDSDGDADQGPAFARSVQCKVVLTNFVFIDIFTNQVLVSQLGDNFLRLRTNVVFSPSAPLSTPLQIDFNLHTCALNLNLERKAFERFVKFTTSRLPVLPPAPPREPMQLDLVDPASMAVRLHFGQLTMLFAAPEKHAFTHDLKLVVGPLFFENLPLSREPEQSLRLKGRFHLAAFLLPVRHFASELALAVSSASARSASGSWSSRSRRSQAVDSDGVLELPPVPVLHPTRIHVVAELKRWVSTINKLAAIPPKGKVFSHSHRAEVTVMIDGLSFTVDEPLIASFVQGNLQVLRGIEKWRRRLGLEPLGAATAPTTKQSSATGNAAPPASGAKKAGSSVKHGRSTSSKGSGTVSPAKSGARTAGSSIESTPKKRRAGGKSGGSAVAPSTASASRKSRAAASAATPGDTTTTPRSRISSRRGKRQSTENALPPIIQVEESSGSDLSTTRTRGPAANETGPPPVQLPQPRSRSRSLSGARGGGVMDEDSDEADGESVDATLPGAVAALASLVVPLYLRVTLTPGSGTSDSADVDSDDSSSSSGDSDDDEFDEAEANNADPAGDSLADRRRAARRRRKKLLRGDALDGNQPDGVLFRLDGMPRSRKRGSPEGFAGGVNLLDLFERRKLVEWAGIRAAAMAAGGGLAGPPSTPDPSVEADGMTTHALCTLQSLSFTLEHREAKHCKLTCNVARLHVLASHSLLLIPLVVELRPHSDAIGQGLVEGTHGLELTYEFADPVLALLSHRRHHSPAFADNESAHTAVARLIGCQFIVHEQGAIAGAAAAAPQTMVEEFSRRCELGDRPRKAAAAAAAALADKTAELKLAASRPMSAMGPTNFTGLLRHLSVTTEIGDSQVSVRRSPEVSGTEELFQLAFSKADRAIMASQVWQFEKSLNRARRKHEELKTSTDAKFAELQTYRESVEQDLIATKLELAEARQEGMQWQKQLKDVERQKNELEVKIKATQATFNAVVGLLPRAHNKYKAKRDLAAGISSASGESAVSSSVAADGGPLSPRAGAEQSIQQIAADRLKLQEELFHARDEVARLENHISVLQQQLTLSQADDEVGKLRDDLHKLEEEHKRMKKKKNKQIADLEIHLQTRDEKEADMTKELYYVKERLHELTAGGGSSSSASRTKRLGLTARGQSTPPDGLSSLDVDEDQSGGDRSDDVGGGAPPRLLRGAPTPGRESAQPDTRRSRLIAGVKSLKNKGSRVEKAGASKKKGSAVRKSRKPSDHQERANGTPDHRDSSQVPSDDRSGEGNDATSGGAGRNRFKLAGRAMMAMQSKGRQMLAKARRDGAHSGSSSDSEHDKDHRRTRGQGLADESFDDDDEDDEHDDTDNGTNDDDADHVDGGDHGADAESAASGGDDGSNDGGRLGTIREDGSLKGIVQRRSSKRGLSSGGGSDPQHHQQPHDSGSNHLAEDDGDGGDAAGGHSKARSRIRFAPAARVGKMLSDRRHRKQERELAMNKGYKAPPRLSSHVEADVDHPGIATSTENHSGKDLTVGGGGSSGAPVDHLGDESGEELDAPDSVVDESGPSTKKGRSFKAMAKTIMATKRIRTTAIDRKRQDKHDSLERVIRTSHGNLSGHSGNREDGSSSASSSASSSGRPMMSSSESSSGDEMDEDIIKAHSEMMSAAAADSSFKSFVHNQRAAAAAAASPFGSGGFHEMDGDDNDDDINDGADDDQAGVQLTGDDQDIFEARLDGEHCELTYSLTSFPHHKWDWISLNDRLERNPKKYVKYSWKTGVSGTMRVKKPKKAGVYEFRVHRGHSKQDYYKVVRSSNPIVIV